MGVGKCKATVSPPRGKAAPTGITDTGVETDDLSFSTVLKSREMILSYISTCKLTRDNNFSVILADDFFNILF